MSAMLMPFDNLFKTYGKSIELIIHCAAQPSHDWAAREPMTDFSINAMGTLTLLEATQEALRRMPHPS